MIHQSVVFTSPRPHQFFNFFFTLFYNNLLLDYLDRRDPFDNSTTNLHTRSVSTLFIFFPHVSSNLIRHRHVHISIHRCDFFFEFFLDSALPDPKRTRLSIILRGTMTRRSGREKNPIEVMPPPEAGYCH